MCIRDRPYVSDGHIEVDMVQADHFFPTKFNSRGEVIAAVFMETVTIGKQVYTRLEYHQHDENTTYHIMNKAFVRQDLDNVEVLGKDCLLYTSGNRFDSISLISRKHGTRQSRSLLER